MKKSSCLNQKLRLCVLSRVMYKSVMVSSKSYERFLMLSGSALLVLYDIYIYIFFLPFSNSSKRDIGSCCREPSERLINHMAPVMGKMLLITTNHKTNSFS